jgi:hypothetical protein
MKNIIVIFILFTINSFSQITINPLFYNPLDYSNNVYNKDIDDDYSNFVGTWLYENGNKKLTFVFNKLIQYQFNFKNNICFEDLLIGEYQFEINNQIIINTLPNLNNTSINAFSHNILSIGIVGQGGVPIENGAVNERWVEMSFSDPNRTYLKSKLKMKFVIQNGEYKIVAKLIPGSPYVEPFDNAPNDTTVPSDEYILIKQ